MKTIMFDETKYKLVPVTEQPKPEPVAWMHEDTLPPEYPYDAMFPFSKVDGVRMFPVYAPPASAIPEGWKPVPIEPTKGMLCSLDEMRPVVGYPENQTPEYIARFRARQHAANADTWSAMLAAAPEVPRD